MACSGWTQQTSLNTLYEQNGYLINPAFAGLETCFSAYLNHRNQWVGIANSPVRNVLTVDGRLTGNHGLGMDIRTFSAGLLRDFNAKITYAYHLRLSETLNLGFGMSVGIVQQGFGFSDAVVSDYTDHFTTAGNTNDVGFLADAGLLLSSVRLKIGVSIPRVLSGGLISEDLQQSEFRLMRHLNVNGSYDVISNQKWRLTPSVLYKSEAFQSAHQVDIGLQGMWKKTLGAGVIYRTGYGVIGVLDLNIKEKFKLSYGYGAGGSQLTNLSGGSHEVMLGIRLCRPTEQVIKEELEISGAEKLADDPVKIDPEPEVEEVIDPEVTEEAVPEEIEVPETVEITQEILVLDTVVLSEQVVEENKFKAPVLTELKITLDLDSLNKVFAREDHLMMYDLNITADAKLNSQRDVTAQVVDIMQAYPELKVKITGHACDIGSESYNRQLGLNRALTAKRQLVHQGVGKDRITVTSLGETVPVRPNTSETNRALNRRVQFVFYIE